MMDQSAFESILKDITASAEVIRSRQDQKQAVLNDFDKERQRLKQGKISKKALKSSVPKVRKELMRLNKDIRNNIRNLESVANRAKKFAGHQTPKSFIVSTSGFALGGAKTHHHKKHHKKR